MDEETRIRKRKRERERYAKKNPDAGKRGERGIADRDLRLSDDDNKQFLIALQFESGSRNDPRRGG